MPQETIPGIVLVICKISIEEQRPLLAGYTHLATTEFLLHAEVCVRDWSYSAIEIDDAYWGIDQSTPAGQSIAPVVS
jgi:hypothetical protein